MCIYFAHSGEMTDLPVNDRLKALRLRGGYTVREFAQALGYGERYSTYASYEGKYKKPYLPVDLVKTMLPLLLDRGDPPITAGEVWALAGVAPGTDGIAPSIERAERMERTKNPKHGEVVINEFDVSPQAGGGALVAENGGEGDMHTSLATWTLPKAFLENYVPDSSGLAVVRVIGNSMEPDFMPGDRVLVDTHHKLMSHDGVYVLWNGHGVVIKQLQLVPRSDPERVRIISVNKTYDTDEVLLSEIEINGRVVGKWTWK
ncbi:S24 family peptidase [Gluconobacter sp. Dm-44]|uniref:S24 family peptidase n=1 Tax=Gluconobacter sp. Dm-44 TaxID=2799805 RepID=UPI002011CAFD|nr:S24 family peptidase [Gluconobacter sp. Dm-44]